MVNLIRGSLPKQTQNVRAILDHYYEPQEASIGFYPQKLTYLFSTVLNWTLKPWTDGSHLDQLSHAQCDQLRYKTIRMIESAENCGQIEHIRKNTSPWVLSKNEFRALTWKMLEWTPTEKRGEFVSDWPKIWRALAACRWERQLEIVALIPIDFLINELGYSQTRLIPSFIDCANLKKAVQDRVSSHYYSEFLSTCDVVFRNLIDGEEVTVKDSELENGFSKGVLLLEENCAMRLPIFLNISLISHYFLQHLSGKKVHDIFPNNFKYFDWNKISDVLYKARQDGVLDDFPLLATHRHSQLLNKYLNQIVIVQQLLRELALVSDLGLFLNFCLMLAPDGSHDALLEKILRLLQLCPALTSPLFDVLDTKELPTIENIVNSLLELLENPDEEDLRIIHEMFKVKPVFYFKFLKLIIKRDPLGENSLESIWRPLVNHYRTNASVYAEFHYPQEPYDYDLDCFEYVADLIYIAPQWGEDLLDLTLLVRDNEMFHMQLTVFVRDLIYKMKDPEGCFRIAYYLLHAKWHTEFLAPQDPLLDDIITLGEFSETDIYHPLNIWWMHKQNEGNVYSVKEPSFTLCGTMTSLSLTNVQALAKAFIISKDRIPDDVSLQVWKELLNYFECELCGWNAEEIQIVVKEEFVREEALEREINEDSNEDEEGYGRESPRITAYFGGVRQFDNNWATSFGDPLIDDWIDVDNYPESVPFYKAQFAAIVHWILTLSTETPSDNELSPRNEAMYKLMQSVLWCSEAKRNGIAIFYFQLPDEFKYPCEGFDIADEEVIRGKQSIALLVQGFLEKTVNNDGFLRELTGLSRTELVVSQAVHQITYTINLIGPSIGLNYNGTLFDLHTQTLYESLIKREPEEVLAIFLNFARPKDLITHLIDASKPNFRLNQSFINIIPPSYAYWDFNEDLTQIQLKPEGALRLLQLEGYIQTTESSRIEHWIPQIFLTPSDSDELKELFEEFSWNQSQNLSRQLQQKRIILDKLFHAANDPKSRMWLYLMWLKQSSTYKKILIQTVEKRHHESFEKQWFALFIEPVIHNIAKGFQETVARTLTANPHHITLITFYEQRDLLIRYFREPLSDQTHEMLLKEKLDTAIREIVSRELDANLEKQDLIPALSQMALLSKISDPGDPVYTSIQHKLHDPKTQRRRWEKFKLEFHLYHKNLRMNPFDLSEFTEFCKRALMLLPEGDKWIAPGYEQFLNLFAEIIITIESKDPLLHIFDLKETKAIYNRLMKRLNLPSMQLTMHK